MPALDPFATAMKALFASPVAVAATYVDALGNAKPIRVLLVNEPDVLGGRAVALTDAAVTFEVSAADLPAPPQAGDGIEYDLPDGTRIARVVQGVPSLDAHGLIWSLNARFDWRDAPA